MNPKATNKTALMGASFSSLWLVATAFGGAACTSDSNNALQIIHNQAPSEDCMLRADKAAPFISRGVLDTGGSQTYLFTPLVENRAEALNANDPLQRAVFVEGAEISLSIPDGAASVSGDALNFTQRFSGTVEPGALGTFAFEIIPTAVTESIANNLTPPATVQVLAEIEIFGTLGGGDTNSPTFTYPITFCTGCRRAAPTCVGYEPPDEISCFPGQDAFAIECCQNSAGDIVCPPVPE